MPTLHILISSYYGLTPILPTCHVFIRIDLLLFDCTTKIADTGTIPQGMKSKTWKFITRSVLFGVLLDTFLLILYKTFSHFSGGIHLLDFDNYLHLLSDIRQGMNPYTVHHMITLGPPLVVLFYIPFSFFSLRVAQILFLLFNVVSGVFGCIFLARMFFPKHSIVTTLVLLNLLFGSFPARFSLLVGQPGLFLFLCLVLLLKTKDIKISALLLSIVISAKTFFLLLIPAYVGKKGWIVILTGIVLGCVLLLSFAVIRPEWYVYYLTHTLKQTTLGQNNAQSLDYYNQSIKSTFTRLGVENVYPAFFLTFLVVGIIVLFFSQNIEDAIIFSILVSPVVWQHYLVMLFGLYVSVIARTKSWLKFMVLGISFLLWSINIPILSSHKPTFIYGIFASHGFVSILLLWIALHLVDYEQSGKVMRLATKK